MTVAGVGTGTDETHPDRRISHARNAISAAEYLSVTLVGCTVAEARALFDRQRHQWVPEGETAKNRWHIDIRVAGEGPRSTESEKRMRAKVAALVAAGSSVVRDEYYGDELGHVVKLDPEGNEFCVG